MMSLFIGVRDVARARRVPAILACLALLACVATAAPAESGVTPAMPVGLGLDVKLGEAAAAAALMPQREDAATPPALALRVEVPWNEVESAAGEMSYGALDAVLSAAAERGTPLILVLTGPAPDGSFAPDVQLPPLTGGLFATADTPALTHWLEFVTRVTERAAGRVASFGAWDRADDPASWGRAPSPREHAYLLKRTALAIKAVQPDALIASGTLAANISYLSDLMKEGSAAFVDAWGFDFAGIESEQAGIARQGLLKLLLQADPAAALWVHERPLEPPRASALWEQALAVRDGDVTLTSFALPDPGGDDTADVGATLAAYARAFPADSAPAPSFGREVVRFPEEPATMVHRELVASDFGHRVSFRSAGPPAKGAYVDVRVDAPNAENLRLIDPRPEWDGPCKQVVRNGERGFVVRVPLLARTLVLAFEKPEAAEPTSEEQTGVVAESLVDVEEILAKHLAVQAAEDRNLRSLDADLSTEIWYQLGASGRALEMRIEGRYFQDDTGRRDVENQRYFLNGAPLRAGKKGLPEIPLLQPEKVSVIPLDVHLDKSYSYSLVRKDSLRGRPAWVVDFKPLTNDATRFSGTAWIDRENFQRLKVQTMQTQLEAPVVSSEQEDFYESVKAADGSVHQVITSSDVQRSVSLLGANVVVRMKMNFTNHRINGADFIATRDLAYSSDHQMLRETDEGFQYLRKKPDGTREAGPTDPRKIAWAAGMRYDSSYGGVLPLGGFNYLDWDVGGKGLQLNAFVAGAFNTLSLADPTLWGTKLQGSVNVSLPLVRLRDQLLLPGQEIDDETTVRANQPSLNLGLGVPVGQFGKFSVDLDMDYQNWQVDDDTHADFEPPPPTWVGALRLTGEFHRSGWDARASIEQSHRTKWEPWGPGGGTESEQYFEEGDEDYWRWRMSLAKRWFLPKYQAVSLGVQWHGSGGLDRFSQYEFSGFGGPDVPGFGGSGLHFNEGGILRASWGVDVGGLFGLDFIASYAKVRNGELPEAVEAEFGEWADALGIGIVGTIPGPARSVILIDIGYAVHSSDYEDAEGGLVAQVLFTKIVK